MSSLLDLLPLVVVLAPAAGCVIVGQLTSSAVRRAFAIIVATVTLVVSICLCLLEAPSFSVPWIAHLGASFVLEPTSRTAVFVLCVAVMSWVAVLVSGNRESRSPIEARTVFAIEASLIGVFLARDILLLLCFLGAATASLMVSLADGARRRTGLVLVVSYAAAFTTLLGVVGAGFQMVRSQTGFASTNPNHWLSLVLYPELQPAILAVVLAVTAVWLGLFPFAAWIRGSVESSSSPSRRFFFAGLGLAASYIFLDKAAPALPFGVAALAPVGLAVGGASMVYAALTSHSSLVTLGAGYHGMFVVLSMSEPASELSVLLWVVHSFACLVCLAVVGLGGTRGPSEREGARGWAMALSFLVSWFAIGAPGTLGFEAIRLDARAATGSATALASLFGFGLVAFAVLRSRRTIFDSILSLSTLRKRLLVVVIALTVGAGIASRRVGQSLVTPRDDSAAAARAGEAQGLSRAAYSPKRVGR